MSFQKRMRPPPHIKKAEYLLILNGVLLEGKTKETKEEKEEKEKEKKEMYKWKEVYIRIILGRGKKKSLKWNEPD